MEEKVIEIVADASDKSPEEVTLSSEFAKDLGINSVEFADVAFSCEEEFDIEVDDKIFRKIITVGDLCDYIKTKLG